MNPNISNNNCPTCCANRREDRRIVDEGDDGDTYCDDPWHGNAPPTPAPADDAGGAVAPTWAIGALLTILGVYRDKMPHDAVIALQALADKLGNPLTPAPRERDPLREAAREAVVEAAKFAGYEVERARFDAWWADKSDGYKRATGKGADLRGVAWDAYYERALRGAKGGA